MDVPVVTKVYSKIVKLVMELHHGSVKVMEFMMELHQKSTKELEANLEASPHRLEYSKIRCVL